MTAIRKGRSVRARSIVASAAVLALAACGGGDGGSGAFPWLPAASAPVPAEQAPDAPSPEAQTSSADRSSGPCLNEADLREGTNLKLTAKPEAQLTDPDATTRRIEGIVGTRESFAGASPVTVRRPEKVIEQSVPGATQLQRSAQVDYLDLNDGRLRFYGKRVISSYSTEGTILGQPDSRMVWHWDTTTSYDPPITLTAHLQPSESVSQTWSRRRVSRGRTESSGVPGIKSGPVPDHETATQGRSQLTYVGRETVNTPAGSYDSCKFSLLTTLEGNADAVQSRDFWLAAEGPYRGQLLKEVKNSVTWVATQIDYAPE